MKITWIITRIFIILILVGLISLAIQENRNLEECEKYKDTCQYYKCIDNTMIGGSQRNLLKYATCLIEEENVFHE